MKKMFCTACNAEDIQNSSRHMHHARPENHDTCLNNEKVRQLQLLVPVATLQCQKNIWPVTRKLIGKHAMLLNSWQTNK
jgi:hypothetical protein